MVKVALRLGKVTEVEAVASAATYTECLSAKIKTASADLLQR